MQDPETPNPVTPTEWLHKAGASQDNPDAENFDCQYYSNEPQHKKKKMQGKTKKLELYLIVYVPIRQWPKKLKWRRIKCGLNL